jgi:glycosyltransferase 2 family protein
MLGLGWLLDTTLVVEGDIAATVLHLPVALVITLGAIGLAKDAGYLVFVARRRTPVSVGGLSVQLPSLPMTLLQAAIGVLQISLVATLLYSLMPPELEMGLMAFIPVYVIAILVANSSHVPAGLGVLEASLLLMLPQVPASKLLGAVLAYRAIFDLLPLMMSVLLLTVYEAGSRHGLAGRWWRVTGREAANSEAALAKRASRVSS